MWIAREEGTFSVTHFDISLISPFSKYSCVLFKSLHKYFPSTSFISQDTTSPSLSFMENRLKLKIHKLFQSCRPKNISDDPFFFPENRHHPQLIALFSPNPHSLSKPKHNPQINHKPKISHKTTKKKPPRHRKPKKTECISSTTYNYYYDWRSSDEGDDIDDTTTLFSSTRSLRSESSGSFRKNKPYRESENKVKKTRQRGFNNPKDSGNGKLVKDSFAVAKKSSNPHEDFRVSMVEMIVEKQIYGADELMGLFECFISLNSDEHHRVIFEVFTEILEAMFSA